MLEMPDEYVRFLLWRNGGDPPKSGFRWTHPTEGAKTGYVDNFFGYDPKPIGSGPRHLDLVWAILKFRHWMPRWSIPVGFANHDDFLITFSNLDDRAGQVWIKNWGHDIPDDRIHPDDGTHMIAKSFVDFTNSLLETDEDGEIVE